MNARNLQASVDSERPPFVAALIGSFLAMVAVDFLFHAVLLSQWWRATATFWRPPNQLFAYIPYAYASFVLYAAGLNWLLIRLKGNRPSLRAATLVGAAAGAIVGAAGVLATYSAVPLPLSALLVFPLSFVAVLAAGCTASTLVLTAARPWRRVALLAAASLAVFALGVILQNVLFPTPDQQPHPAPVTQAPAVRLAPSCAAA